MRVLGQAPSEARRRREIGFVFQDATLLPWRSALDNVRLPLQVGGATRLARTGRSPEELLALVGLAGWEHALPHELSGGMRQRVSIARALLGDPRMLLMDEPFGALDEITRDRLNDELLHVWRETGTTILFVTHSIQEAAYLGQRVLMLAANPGRVRELIPIDLPEPRHLAVRDTAEFGALAGASACRAGDLLMATNIVSWPGLARPPTASNPCSTASAWLAGPSSGHDTQALSPQ